MIHSLDVNNQTKEEVAKKRVLDVAERYNLDIEGELDEVSVGYLGPYTLGQASWNGRTEISFDNKNFFSRSKEQQELTALHELLHVKQFNKSLGEWADKNFDISPEFRQELDSNYKSRADMEGEVEVLINELIDTNFGAYPYWQKQKESELTAKGIDVGSELMKDIEALEDEIMEEYREIYTQFEMPGIYHEKGSYKGIGYEFSVFGTDSQYGEEVVEDYLETVSEILEPGNSRSKTDNEDYIEV